MPTHFNSVINSLLQESNFILDDDVDTVIETLRIDSMISDYKNDPTSMEWYGTLMDKFSNVPHLSIMGSDQLNGVDGQRAHQKLPIQIKLVSRGGHGYIPNQKVILLAMPSYVIRDLGPRGLSNVEVLSENPDYAKYFDIGYWRSVVAHELTHWMEDALYGGKIAKGHDRFKAKRMDLTRRMNRQSTKAGTDRGRDKLDQLELDKAVTGGDETEAVIAQLKQRKRTVGDERWNAMTFKDLYKLDPILKHYIDKARNGTKTGRFQNDKKGLSDRDFKGYIQRLIQKMDRVGILGGNMRNPVGDN